MIIYIGKRDTYIQYFILRSVDYLMVSQLKSKQGRMLNKQRRLPLGRALKTVTAFMDKASTNKNHLSQYIR